MNDWPTILAFGAILIGLAAGVFVYARSPIFWLNMATAFAPIVLKVILKRMPPDEEAEWRHLQLSGASKEEIMAWERQRMLKRRFNKGN